MTVIAEKDRPTVRDLLARELREDVELLLFTRGRSNPAISGREDGLTCDETQELLEELTGLSDQLHLTIVDLGADAAIFSQFNVTAVPTVIIRRRDFATRTSRPVAHEGEELAETGQFDAVVRRTADGEPGSNVRFLGLPGGYEFTALLADVVDISKGRTDLSPIAQAAVEAIESPMHIQVFVTPACPYCPRAARLAHQMAMVNPLILADVIEANEFQELSERYRVRSVPKTIINNRIEFVGSLPEAKLLEALQKAVSGHA